MTTQEFEQMLELNQPHELFKKDWFSYYGEDFGKTFLPNVPNYSDNSRLWIFDGAGFFQHLSVLERKFFSLSGDKNVPNVLIFTYPKGVLAEEQKTKLSLSDEEIVLFVEQGADDAVAIYFLFGKVFQQYLDAYFGDGLLTDVLESRIYETNRRALFLRTEKVWAHDSAMLFLLGLLGVEPVEVGERKPIVISDIVWKNGNIKKLTKDSEGFSSAKDGKYEVPIRYGEHLRLEFTIKELKKGDVVQVSFGYVLDEKTIYEKINKTEWFTVNVSKKVRQNLLMQILKYRRCGRK